MRIILSQAMCLSKNMAVAADKTEKIFRQSAKAVLSAVPARLLIALAASLFFAAESLADEPPGCTPRSGVEFLCGPEDAEDLVWLPGTGKFIASGLGGEFSGGGSASGRLHLVDPQTGDYDIIYPGKEMNVALDDAMFPDCPGAPDPDDFSAHGLSVRTTVDGRIHLYVVGHGGREAIEAFQLSPETPESPTWIGCVIAPDDAWLNSVAILEDGGFFTTRMSERGNADYADKMARGENTGYVYVWHPGGAMTKVPGTDLPGPNGIVISPEGDALYVASWGSSEVIRYKVNGDTVAEAGRVKLQFGPDNLRWTDSGTILAAGQETITDSACDQLICLKRWVVAEVDPGAMTGVELASFPSLPGFTAATAAIRGDNGLWVGTFDGDRIVFVPDSGEEQ